MNINRKQIIIFAVILIIPLVGMAYYLFIKPPTKQDINTSSDLFTLEDINLLFSFESGEPSPLTTIKQNIAVPQENVDKFFPEGLFNY